MSNSEKGRFSRNKGKTFERRVAIVLREAFPEYAEIIRRSVQSREAEESDVAGLPGCWVECQHAANPTPLKKLEQAEHDVMVAKLYGEILPIAVTHKTRTKGVFVTLRMHHLDHIFGHHINDYRYCTPLAYDRNTPPVTISLEDFIVVAKEYIHASFNKRQGS